MFIPDDLEFAAYPLPSISPLFTAWIFARRSLQKLLARCRCYLPLLRARIREFHDLRYEREFAVSTPLLAVAPTVGSQPEDDTDK